MFDIDDEVFIAGPDYRDHIVTIVDHNNGPAGFREYFVRGDVFVFGTGTFITDEDIIAPA